MPARRSIVSTPTVRSRIAISSASRTKSEAAGHGASLAGAGIVNLSTSPLIPSATAELEWAAVSMWACHWSLSGESLDGVSETSHMTSTASFSAEYIAQPSRESAERMTIDIATSASSARPALSVSAPSDARWSSSLTRSLAVLASDRAFSNTWAATTLVRRNATSTIQSTGCATKSEW